MALCAARRVVSVGGDGGDAGDGGDGGDGGFANGNQVAIGVSSSSPATARTTSLQMAAAH